ncbi:MAG: hypothetical protein SFU99_02640, partial [Saprospiraceae bacterium]|nr:hypothetical protein [Saprospiraceae bacterium]
LVFISAYLRYLHYGRKRIEFDEPLAFDFVHNRHTSGFAADLLPLDFNICLRIPSNNSNVRGDELHYWVSIRKMRINFKWGK